MVASWPAATSRAREGSKGLVVQTQQSGISDKRLVAAVFGVAGVLGHDPPLASALDDLFEYRNEVAHGGVESSREKAIEVLTLVRGTVD